MGRLLNFFFLRMFYKGMLYKSNVGLSYTFSSNTRNNKKISNLPGDLWKIENLFPSLNFHTHFLHNRFTFYMYGRNNRKRYPIFQRIFGRLDIFFSLVELSYMFTHNGQSLSCHARDHLPPTDNKHTSTTKNNKTPTPPPILPSNGNQDYCCSSEY